LAGATGIVGAAVLRGHVRSIATVDYVGAGRSGPDEEHYAQDEEHDGYGECGDVAHGGCLPASSA
jgi:hypothetical protein